MATKFLDKTGLGYFWSKIKAWCNATFAAITHSHAWSAITGKPTTVSGYGITDAKINSGTITLGSNSITPLTSHQDISGKVNKSGDTLTGKFLLKVSETRGVAPSEYKQYYTDLVIDSAGNGLGGVLTEYFPSKSSRTRFVVYDTTVASGGSIGELTIGCDSNGSVFTVAPTPPTADNSTQIATTAFVKAQGYVTANSKVQQFEGTINSERPILSRWNNDEDSGTASYAVYDKNITINPNQHTLAASGGFKGNADTATKLYTARTINGVSFDGSANITITDDTKLPNIGGYVWGNIVRHVSDIRGTAPSERHMYYTALVRDYNQNALGGVVTEYFTDKSSVTRLLAVNSTIATGDSIASLGIGCDSNGSAYTFAPTPATSDNSTKIATTAFVKNQNYTTATGHTHSYLPLSGGTLTGGLTLEKSSITRGSSTTYVVTGVHDVVDSAGNRVGCLLTEYNKDKSSRTSMLAYNTTIASGSNIGRIAVGCDSSGNVYTQAPTPATADNSTKIATTAFVKAQGYTTATGHTHSYLPLSGGTLTGGLTITNSNNLKLNYTGITRGTAPSTDAYPFFVIFTDNTDNPLGGLYYEYFTNKVARTHLMCYQGTTNANVWNSIGIGYDASGDVFTWAPTPVTADNSTKIATTAFVKAQGYLTSHQSLANYVTLNSDQNIGGVKRFTSGLSRKNYSYDVTVKNPASDIWSGIGFSDKNNLDMFNFNLVQKANARVLTVNMRDINKENHWPFSITLPADASSAGYLSLAHTYPMSSQNTLGNSNHKWGSVWAVNGTIQTSDERVKEDINTIPDEVLDAWEQVEWLQFKMKDSVKAKGSKARLHSGVIAQRIKSVFDLLNIDPADYGFFCWDEWDAVPAFYSEDGNIITDEIPAGEQYSIRYDEALAIEAAYQRRKNKILENRISELETQVQNMLQVLESLKGA